MRAVTQQAQLTARFRYFGSLQKLLRFQYRPDPLLYHFEGHPGVKNAIETMGIPHTEVEALLVNHQSVGLDYQLQDHDLVDVYPLDTPVPLAAHQSLTSVTKMPIGFVADVHLGKLARRLRLLGFDCLYRNDFKDSEIIQISVDEERVILTRDLGILKHRQVCHGYLVRSGQIDEQVREVLVRYKLFDKINPWRRCVHCNGFLSEVKKDAVQHRLEPMTQTYYEVFHECADCEHLYWQGSHFEKMTRWIDDVLRWDQAGYEGQALEAEPDS